MSDTFAPILPPDTQSQKVAVLTLNPSQVAATYDLGAVSGGAIYILDAIVYVATALGGLISVAIQTNDTTPVVLMSAAEGAVANLTGGKNAKVFTTPTVLASGKKLQYTIVGTGNAGVCTVYVRYQPLAAGAVLA